MPGKPDIKESRKIRKLKRFLIDPHFQLRLLLLFLVPFLIIFILYSGSLYYFFYELNTIGLIAKFDSDHIYFEFIQKQETLLWSFFISTSVIAFVILIFGGLWLSHKVSGPMYRLKNHLNDLVEKKQLFEIHFRQGEYLAEVEKSFNDLVKVMSEK